MNPNSWQNRRQAAAVILSPHNLRRTVCIALSVGTVFFTMNQLGIVLAGHAGTIVWLKAALTYLTPLVVSNIGVLSATRRPVPAGSVERTP
jgi:hypothetical protein